MEKKVNTHILLATEKERKEIGERLKKIRRKKKVTQEAMSCGTGLSEKTIREMEAGRTSATYDTICIVSSYLMIDPDVFFPVRILEQGSRFEPEICSLLKEVEELDEAHKKEFMSFTGMYLKGIKREISEKRNPAAGMGVNRT